MAETHPDGDVSGAFREHWEKEKQDALQDLCQTEELLRDGLETIIDEYLFTERPPRQPPACRFPQGGRSFLCLTHEHS